MSDSSGLSVVILAAGKGTRMKSEKAKVLHQAFYAPMLHHVLRAVKPLQPDSTIVIIGHQREEVERSLSGFDVTPCLQEKQLGTGHAVLCAEPILAAQRKVVMILCGDTPLIQSETLIQMYRMHLSHGGPITIMTTVVDNPANYGRIVSDDAGHVQAIIEEKDATPEQRKIREINAGIYCVDSEFLFTSLKRVDRNNSQGEMYLTDIVSISVAMNAPVAKCVTSHPQDVLGVNSRIELAEAHRQLQIRRNRHLMLDGITMIDPATISVAPEVQIGSDTVLYPGVHLVGHSIVGKNCTLENGVMVKDSSLGAGTRVGAYSCLDGCTIEAGSTMAPHTILGA